MNKALAVVLLVIGAIVLIFGLNAGESFASEVSEVVHGTPTDRSIVLIVIGSLLGLAGLIGLFAGAKRA